MTIISTHLIKNSWKRELHDLCVSLAGYAVHVLSYNLLLTIYVPFKSLIDVTENITVRYLQHYYASCTLLSRTKFYNASITWKFIKVKLSFPKIFPIWLKDNCCFKGFLLTRFNSVNLKVLCISCFHNICCVLIMHYELYSKIHNTYVGTFRQIYIFVSCPFKS